MEKIPPFQPGDRVVRIGETVSLGGPVKGQMYTVSAITWCCHWKIDLEEQSFSAWIAAMYNHGYRWDGCRHCDEYNKGWDACQFSKLDDLSEHTTESLLQELGVPVKEPALISQP